MWKNLIGALLLAAAVASPAQAQEPKVEITGNIGFTSSSGVSGRAEGSDGNVYQRIEPEDGVSYGFTLGFFVSEGVEVGFQWHRQSSSLLVTGETSSDVVSGRDIVSATRVGDMNVDNYHGYFAYNFADFDARVRPYVLIGLGATGYGSVDFTAGGERRSTSSLSRFSTTWGAGVKIYAGRHVGVRLGARWTPTYITSESTGWWCDPWWGCYVVGEAKYSHQFDVSGGVVFRF